MTQQRTMFISTGIGDPFAGAIDYLIQRVCAEASYDVEVIRHSKFAPDQTESLDTVRALEKSERNVPCTIVSLSSGPVGSVELTLPDGEAVLPTP